MAAEATTNHEEIRRWVEKRGGRPARVKATGSGEDPGILRIDFPGYSGEETLETIDWDEWFDWFDRNKLAILLDARGRRFNKLVSRASARRSGRSATRGRGANGGAKAAGARKRGAKASAAKGGAKRATSRSGADGATRPAATKSRAKKAGGAKTSARTSGARATSARKSAATKTATKSATKATTGRKGGAARAAGSTRRAAAPAKRTAPAKRASSAKRTASKRGDGNGSAVTTTNHNQIRKWVESRGGFPAHVKRTGRRSDPGVLRIDYPGFSGTKSLERISWDEWFDAFDRNKLAFLYQDRKNSRFSKLIER